MTQFGQLITTTVRLPGADGEDTLVVAAGVDPNSGVGGVAGGRRWSEAPLHHRPSPPHLAS